MNPHRMGTFLSMDLFSSEFSRSYEGESMNYRASLPRKQLICAAFGTLLRPGEGRAHDKLAYSGQHEFLSFANVDVIRPGRTANSSAAEFV